MASANRMIRRLPSLPEQTTLLLKQTLGQSAAFLLARAVVSSTRTSGMLCGRLSPAEKSSDNPSSFLIAQNNCKHCPHLKRIRKGFVKEIQLRSAPSIHYSPSDRLRRKSQFSISSGISSIFSLLCPKGSNTDLTAAKRLATIEGSTGFPGKLVVEHCDHATWPGWFGFLVRLSEGGRGLLIQGLDVHSPCPRPPWV
jgi:hypothetical protein